MTVGGEERGGGQQQVEHGVVPLHHGQLGSRVTSTVRDVHIRTNLGIEGNGYIKVISWAIRASNEGSRSFQYYYFHIQDTVMTLCDSIPISHLLKVFRRLFSVLVDY